MLAQSTKPDDKGNPIPANATFGTLRVEPADGQPIERLMVTATVYDPVAGTCSCIYTLCNTPTELDLENNPLTGAVTTTQQVTATVQWDDGSSTDATLHTRFSSSASSIISVQNTPGTTGNGMATFSNVGTSTITGNFTVSGGDGADPTCGPTCPPIPLQGSTPGTASDPAQLFVIGDTTTTATNCPNTKIRILAYQIQDDLGTDIKSDVQTKEQFGSKSQNTCNTTITTSQTCSGTPDGIIHDTLTVGCNSVDNGCGYTYTKQQWVWCNGTASTVIGTVGDLVVHDNAISVGGSFTSLKGQVIAP